MDDRTRESADDRWTWCLEAPPATLNRLLAFLVGATLNAVETNPQYGRRRIAAADRLSDCFNLDMTKWWQPSEAYFKRVPKPVAVLAVSEAGCDQAMGSRIGAAKKADAVAITFDALSGKGWLPAPLKTRPVETASEEEPGSEDADARDDEAFDE
jgi:ParB family transcriptional regulator, chromosome partitioning protein